ncbi:MAG TPA: FHA domain-containing protein [Solimonas sp.]|nr:FHA domain-containing protein [Solimonas sp.]
MARLVYRIGTASKVIYLSDQPVGIGRRPDNTIVLEDIAASGRHCWISLASGAYWIEDLKSSNGTLLNGEKVAMARLKNGDAITIGRITIGFFEEESNQDLSGTVRMPAFKSDSMPKPAPARAPAAPPPESPLATLSRTGAAQAAARQAAAAPSRPAPPAAPATSAPAAAAASPAAPPASAPPAPSSPPPAAQYPTLPAMSLSPVPPPLPPPAPAPSAPPPAVPSFTDDDLTPLGPATVSPRKPSVEPASPLGGARFIIPGDDLPPPAAPKSPPSTGVGSQGASVNPTDVDMLDHLVGSIRSHRDREQRGREDARAQLQGEWEKALTYSEQLKLKIGKDPRIKFFGVNRRANDVTIRFQRSPSAPIDLMMLSLDHPENKHQSLFGIWFRRSGEADRCFQTAEELAAEMIREFAFVLA